MTTTFLKAPKVDELTTRRGDRTIGDGRVTMRRGAMLVLVLASGCGAVHALFPIDRQSANAPTIDLHRTYLHEVDYVMLSQTVGEACMGDGDVEFYKGRKSADPDAIEPVVLYERAKYNALTKVNGGDGIVGVVAKTTAHDAQTCVTVAGRAYRISGLRAVAAHEPRRDPDVSPLNDQ